MIGIIASFLALGIAAVAAGLLMFLSDNDNASIFGAIVLLLTAGLFITGFIYL